RRPIRDRPFGVIARRDGNAVALLHTEVRFHAMRKGADETMRVLERDTRVFVDEEDVRSVRSARLPDLSQRARRVRENAGRHTPYLDDLDIELIAHALPSEGPDDIAA